MNIESIRRITFVVLLIVIVVSIVIFFVWLLRPAQIKSDSEGDVTLTFITRSDPARTPLRAYLVADRVIFSSDSPQGIPFAVDFGDDSKDLMQFRSKGCGIESGGCREYWHIKHEYLSPGIYTIKLLESEKVKVRMVVIVINLPGLYWY